MSPSEQFAHCRYSHHRPANVDGTAEIIRMACAGRAVVPVHFLSSMAVFGPMLNVLSSDPDEHPMITEESPRPSAWRISRMRSTMAGYPQVCTRYVARDAD